MRYVYTIAGTIAGTWQAIIYDNKAHYVIQVTQFYNNSINHLLVIYIIKDQIINKYIDSYILSAILCITIVINSILIDYENNKPIINNIKK